MTATTSPAAAAAAARRALVDWLVGMALPLWSRHGVDREGGGFREKLACAGPVPDEPRRTRVAARQVYVFAMAARHGWLEGADALVEHGLRFMLDRLREPEGWYAASVRPDGTRVDARFDLYEQAFALFALASARRDRPDRAALEDPATRLRLLLRARWAHPSGGFEEARPRALPLRSNPHMHLLEAALAWSEAAPRDTRAAWDDLADEIAELALATFIDPATGAVREYFDGDWSPMPGAAGRVVEPGHQFEWAWLLTRWSRRRQRADAGAAAARLLDFGERHGVDATRGAAVNELDTQQVVVDADARLWPQTERLKAWCLAARLAPTEAARDAAWTHVARAAETLRCFLDVTPRGLWRERWTAAGAFVDEPARASSLYHVAGAIEALHEAASEIETPASTGTGAAAKVPHA